MFLFQNLNSKAYPIFQPLLQNFNSQSQKLGQLRIHHLTKSIREASTMTFQVK